MGEVPAGWRKANVAPKKGQKGDPGSNRPVSLTSVLGNHGAAPVGAHFWAHEGECDQNSQHGFTKSNLIACYDEMTVSVDGERTLDVFCVSFMLKGRAVIMAGTQGGWRKGLRGTSRNSVGTTAKSCTRE